MRAFCKSQEGISSLAGICRLIKRLDGHLCLYGRGFAVHCVLLERSGYSSLEEWLYNRQEVIESVI